MSKLIKELKGETLKDSKVEIGPQKLIEEI
jgi:hypothetical protein